MTDARASKPSPLFPERIGRYEILLPIASGGMATVYLARSRGLAGFERDVAVKLTHAHLNTSTEFATELVEEAKLAVRIRHTNVVPVIDVGEDPFGHFLVMDYVEGDTLAGLQLRAAKSGNPLSTAVGLRILVDALAGLHAAHELKGEDGRLVGLVHRDFSPQNILVGLDGVSRLTDFGVAKAASRLSHTRTGGVKGKIAYMSPEQARAKPLDRRCDVWAAGVVAWEILARRRLYGEENDEVGMLLQIATERPPRLRSAIPDVPALLDDAVASALSSDPDKRCPSAAAFERALVEGCKAAGLTLADYTEVASVVESVCGPRLAERRARAKEVFKLRAKVGALAHSSGDTPSSDDAVANALARRHSLPDDATGALERTPSGASAAPPAASDATANTTTISTDRGVLALPSAPPRAPSRRVLAAVGVATVVVVSSLGWLGLRHPRAAVRDDSTASPAGSVVSPAEGRPPSAPEPPTASIAVDTAAPSAPPPPAQAETASAPAPSAAKEKPPLAKKTPPPPPKARTPPTRGGDSFGAGRK